MSGELDARPDLREEFRSLRDRLNELERRVSGDDQGLDLSDINDVRVDSLGDGTISLADGDALVYRAADRLWIPGTAGGGGSGFPVGPYDDGTATYEIQTGAFGALDGAVVTSATHDSNGAAGLLFQGVTDAGQGAVGAAATGSGAVALLALAADAASGAAALSALGDTGTEASITATSPGGSNSSVAVLSDELGFYGATPVVQAGTPTTLGDVITILQDLGLCS